MKRGRERGKKGHVGRQVEGEEGVQVRERNEGEINRLR